MVTDPEILLSYFLRIPGTDQLRFTADGRDAFAQRFARQGVNIDTLKTTAHFLQAHHYVTCAELKAMRCDKNTEPALKPAVCVSQGLRRFVHFNARPCPAPIYRPRYVEVIGILSWPSSMLIWCRIT